VVRVPPDTNERRPSQAPPNETVADQSGGSQSPSFPHRSRGSLASAVTGAVLVDLRKVKPEVAHRRVGNSVTWPDGARVLLVVGALAVNSRVVQLAVEQIPRVHIEVQGESHAVRRWVEALRGADMVTGEFP
jgi:hypothetical protein